MTEATGIVGEFLALKAESEADVLAMQCGDFYEFFGDDAELVADELDLKLTAKSSNGRKYPMAGVPLTELTPYLKALVERGYRVAVADQYETESGHARELTRVATPGTLLETADASARYLAAIVRVSDEQYGLAFADVTTGRFLVTSVAGPDAADRALTECYRFEPVELLPGPEVRDDHEFVRRLRERTGASVSRHDPDAFAPGAATHTTREQFGRETLASLGLDTEARAEVRAAGAILDYVRETGVGVLPSMTRLSPYRGSDHVTLDVTTQRNLELAETMTGGGRSLFETIDHTETSAGGRLLKEWLQRPRRSREVLDRRQACVAALTEATLAREALRDLLSGASDLERLASRAVHGSADARALLSVRDTLALLPELARAVENDPRLADSPLPDVVARPDRERLADLHDAIADAIAEEPAGSLRQGGIIRRGYHDELDALLDRHEAAMTWIETLADREKEAHGISHLQVNRNRTDGYYLQVGKSNVASVPDHYREIKTLKNSKRYTTDELDEREREILRVEEERGALEYELFCVLRDRVADAAGDLQDAGRAIAALDALSSLAVHAVSKRWTRPVLGEPGGPIDVVRGRHPVVEETTDFVPNDVSLGGSTTSREPGEGGDGTGEPRDFLLVTGPNMSGKSTYMRQTALIVLLAQVGSFVPADEAEIGLVDGIYTRVGALDELAQGRSTFMVEMQELSHILHAATDESLVVLDEVGRGTATYDGISIAWAATEYLHNEVHAKTLFATHYHELTALAEHLPRVANVHVAADESDGDVTFLRTVREGPTDRSYGIHVADLAGVPDPVVDRARDVLDRLRTERAIEARGSGTNETVQAVFDLGAGGFRGSANADGGDTPPLDPATESVLEELRGTDVNEVPPIELLARVQEWQRRLEK